MGIGAGQLVLVNGHDLSEDVTSFDHDFSKTLKARTAIGAQVAPARLAGAEGPVVDHEGVLGGRTGPPWCSARTVVQQLMSRAYGLAPGAYTHSFRGAISPKSATETPVEDLVMWSSEGNVNAAGVQEGRLLYAGAADALANGDNDFFDTYPVDIGVDADGLAPSGSPATCGQTSCRTPTSTSSTRPRRRARGRWWPHPCGSPTCRTAPAPAGIAGTRPLRASCSATSASA